MSWFVTTFTVNRKLLHHANLILLTVVYEHMGTFVSIVRVTYVGL